jgi:hypothetical protein
LRKNCINLPAILMSGDASVLKLAQQDILNMPALLHKPFTLLQVSAALAKVGPILRLV